MALRLPLLENESVVCVGPSGMIITSDGWIGEVREHRHEGLSKIFKLLNISAIERKEWVDPISRRLAKGLYFFTVSISVILFILAPFLIGGTDAFWDGYDISGCIESSSDVWVCEEERGEIKGYLSLILPTSLIFVLLLLFIDKDPELILHHSGDKRMIIQDEGTKDLVKYFVVSLFWYASAMPGPGAGLSRHTDALTSVLLVFIIWFLIAQFKKIFPNPDSEDKTLYDQFNLQKFHQELNNQLGDENSSDNFIPTPMVEKIPNDTKPLVSRIKMYERELSKISSDWRDIYNLSSTKSSIGAIRRETEIILHSRIKGFDNPPKLKKPNLTNLQQHLGKADTSPWNVDHEIETIKAFGNKASHVGTPLTNANYISTLQAFAVICEAHFSNPNTA